MIQLGMMVKIIYFITYFLKTTEEVKDADDGETVIEEHNLIVFII